MYHRSAKSLIMIILLINITLYQARPLLQEQLQDSFNNEEIVSDERFDSTYNDRTEEPEDIERNIVSRTEGKYMCAKKSGDKCLKWVRVGFWFGH